MKRSNIIWSLVGIAAVILSGYLLYQEVRSLSLTELQDSFAAIPLQNWLLAGLATLGAYFALAWYDRIAIAYLDKRIPWWYITLCSFTTYALAHNIGASVFSGAVVRYRAYRNKGLNAQEIGTLIVFCSLTFALGTLLAGSLVLMMEPQLLQRFLPVSAWQGWIASPLLALPVLLYILGSRRQGTLNLRSWTIRYPQPPIILRQLIAGPLELLCAAAIIYFALPGEGNPGYIAVLGIFLASFSLALLSHAPGGLGVLEVTFLAALPELATADVLAALIVFRGLYLLLPFALAMLIVLGFEICQWHAARRQRSDLPG